MKQSTIEVGIIDGTITTPVVAGTLVQGRWYMNGDPNKLTEINISGRTLQATNENGQTIRLEMDRYGNIRASDWQVRGDVRRDRID
jgi:hypothetical protein